MFLPLLATVASACLIAFVASVVINWASGRSAGERPWSSIASSARVAKAALCAVRLWRTTGLNQGSVAQKSSCFGTHSGHKSSEADGTGCESQQGCFPRKFG